MFPQLRAATADIPVSTAVFLVGSGDSLSAGMAASRAFERIAGIPCHAVPALELPADVDLFDGSLVVGISASGNTPHTVRALRYAHEAGRETLAVTGNPAGALCAAAARAVCFALPDREPCPAVRTWHASLLALSLLAVQFGVERGTPGAAGLLAEIKGAGSALPRAANLDDLPAIAARIAEASITVVVGSGPERGVARYGAAKFVEATARPAIATGIEEWWHIERHLTPGILIILAYNSRYRERALQTAARATRLGWGVVALAGEGAGDFDGHGVRSLPVSGALPGVLAPLLIHPILSALSGHAALALGQPLFPRRGLEPPR